MFMFPLVPNQVETPFSNVPTNNTIFKLFHLSSVVVPCDPNKVVEGEVGEVAGGESKWMNFSDHFFYLKAEKTKNNNSFTTLKWYELVDSVFDKVL